MNEFLTFRKFVTPVIIQLIFWVFTIICVISGLVVMFSNSFITGLMTILFGPLFVRIYCELLIVIFRIYDAVDRLAKSTSDQIPEETSS